ncbi:hypothetical protein VB151_12435 [Xanthomonas fragariae]|uniref:hypothetical protein n=1 Tax=Xanthomonas fragariae TaxID=48664 RepID=UPI0003A8F3C9|nr:hypothetical protein [Xanthomonas fragariae]MBL9197504.1 hypothetical protein [Xanthomonas fragariae]MBL9222641.1 hypothetical protein [Xanthomonas fragariae]MEA5174501.1 hypothetical protein [Xanthomonas fragariae]MEA5219816.1 hypothetical protein [Xanthomonas fragariae]MEA5233306.1 hypothetical protein [Xanthomonas fragariae]
MQTRAIQAQTRTYLQHLVDASKGFAQVKNAGDAAVALAATGMPIARQDHIDRADGR